MRARCEMHAYVSGKEIERAPTGVARRSAARRGTIRELPPYPALQGVYTGNKFMANGHKFPIRRRLLLSPPPPLCVL